MSQASISSEPRPQTVKDLGIELTPEERENRRGYRSRFLNAIYIPRMRLMGSVIIAIWLYLHMRYISGGTLTLWLMASGVLFAHSMIAWAVLYRYYRPRARVDLSFFFLTTDLFVWIWLIYLTGAEESWLFFLLSVRAADQTPTTFRRTFYFAHVGALLYVAMLGFLYLHHDQVNWGAAWSKAAIIYGFNIYLSLAARTTEIIRRRMAAAIQLSRNLIGDLEQKREELSGALSRSAELERSLAQSQKLESLGYMATGIAHDFNNTMMSALPWTDLIAEKGRDDQQLREAADRIRAAITRAKDVTSHLLGFAQPRPPEIRTVDLRQVILQELQTLRLSLPEEVAVEVVDAKPYLVQIDPSQFAQVVTNLTLNARDAMPDGGVLTLTIRAARTEEHSRPEVGPDTHVALDVSDTGTGMSAEVAARVFDPFFTTKAFGHGTGLGLPVAHRTVQQLGGFIYLRSVPGKGTTFTIVLPVAAGSVSDEEAASPSSMKKEDASHLSFLVVDDDPAVLEGLEMMLEMAGASVTARDSGPEALELLDHGFEPDAIILDLGMPGMGGKEVHDEIRRRGIRTPVVISSGYGEQERISSLLEDGRTFYLQKPYSITDLEAVIDRALKSS